MPPRQTELARFRDGLEKTYGDRVAARRAEPARYDVISSGSLTLDWALRRGGLVRGQQHEIVGAPDSAKTTLVINAMAAAQRKYPRKGVGYVDMEGTFDDEWAVRNGLDIGGDFDHLYADDSEDASDQMRKLVHSGLYSLVVLDSVGAMESRKALAKDAKDELPGRNAQVITRMCKHLGSLTRQTGTTVILVNQLRANIGGMGGDVSAGPKEMKHATTTRIAMSGGREDPVSMIFEEGQPAEIVCLQFKARVTRMKVGPPGRIAEFWVNNRDTPEYGPAGINVIDEYLSVGVRLGAIERDGAGNYTLPGQPKIKGRAAVVQLLRSQPELCEAVRKRIFTETPM
jgi:recombination protein RecA